MDTYHFRYITLKIETYFEYALYFVSCCTVSGYFAVFKERTKEITCANRDFITYLLLILVYAMTALIDLYVVVTNRRYAVVAAISFGIQNTC